MKKVLKKVCVLCSLVFMISFVAGCDNDEEKGSLQEIEESEDLFQKKAEDSLEPFNQKTDDLNQDADRIEQDENE